MPKHTQKRPAGKAPRPRFSLKRNGYSPMVTVHTPTSKASIPLAGVRSAQFRIAYDRDADLRVPGLDVPITLDRVLALTNNSIEECLEVASRDTSTILDRDPIVIRSSNPQIYVVITTT